MTIKKPHEIDVLVGRRIRTARILAGLTQTQLGERLGVAFQQLQKYERGTNRVSASKLWLISQAVGQGIGYFFPADQGPAEADIATKREQLELARNMAKLQPALRHHMHSLARTLARVPLQPH